MKYIAYILLAFTLVVWYPLYTQMTKYLTETTAIEKQTAINYESMFCTQEYKQAVSRVIYNSLVNSYNRGENISIQLPDNTIVKYLPDNKCK